MLRPILLLELPEVVRTKLQSLGFEYVEDIEKVLTGHEGIGGQLKAIADEFKILDRIKSINSSDEIRSAAGLWHDEFSNPPVAVFHKGLDKLLDGGLPVGRITEICGPPGSGKTQMCLQFCVDVQIPSSLGGSAAEALFITTDFGFGTKRLREIIQGSVRHCSTIDFPTAEEKRKALKNFNGDSLLDGVSVIRTNGVSELAQAIRGVGDILEGNKRIKLLIVDSFSLPFVVEVEDLLVRSKIIAETMNVLLENAVRYKLAVVLTNQLMTIVTQNKSVLKPSLGEGFGHRLHVRLLLDDGRIFLTKSINHSQLYTHFEITSEGIR